METRKILNNYVINDITTVILDYAFKSHTIDDYFILGYYEKCIEIIDEIHNLDIAKENLVLILNSLLFEACSGKHIEIVKLVMKRGGCIGNKLTCVYSKLEDSKDRFGIPDLNQTINTYGDYTGLTKHGYPPLGSIINKGDIIIGKYSVLPKDFDSKNKFQDKSIIYRDEETAIIHKIINDRNHEGKLFIKVSIRKLREVQIGQRFSSKFTFKKRLYELLDTIKNI